MPWTDDLGLTDIEGAQEAARESSAALQQAGQQAIGTVEAAQQKYADPYFEAGMGGLGRAIDLIGGRRQQQTPYEQQLMNEALERVNREAAYTGGLGGGQRLKRLQQTSLGMLDQIRQRQIGQELGLAQMGQQAGAMGLQSAGQVSGLQTDIGSAQASGILGEQKAGAAGQQLVGTLLGAGIGYAAGNPMLGAQLGAAATSGDY